MYIKLTIIVNSKCSGARIIWFTPLKDLLFALPGGWDNKEKITLFGNYFFILLLFENKKIFYLRRHIKISILAVLTNL